MEIAKRIIALIEILGLTPGEFADKINVQRSGISHITSGRNKPSLDFLERTMSVFPEINSEWLILGKGRPLKSQNPSQNVTNNNFNASSPPLLFPIDDENAEGKKDSQALNYAEQEKEKQSGEEDISVQKETTAENTDIVEKERTHETEDNKPSEKKKIKKVLILYSDGSFESFDHI